MNSQTLHTVLAQYYGMQRYYNYLKLSLQISIIYVYLYLHHQNYNAVFAKGKKKKKKKEKKMHGQHILVALFYFMPFTEN